MFYQTWYHNTVRFDKMITQFHIGGFHLFHRRSILSAFEKSSKFRIREGQTKGVDVHAIFENHVVKAVSMFSKILLPFLLLLGFILFLAIPSFLCEVIIGSCCSRPTNDKLPEKLRKDS